MSNDSASRYALKRLLKRAGLSGFARRARDLISPSQRLRKTQNRRFVSERRHEILPLAAEIERRAKEAQRVGLLTSYTDAVYIAAQLPLLSALARAGVEPVPILPSLHDLSVQDAYKACGVRRFASWEGFANRVDERLLRESLSACRSIDEVIEIEHDGVRIGKYAVSTLMRRTRMGKFDLAVPKVREDIGRALVEAAESTRASVELLDRWRPKLVAVVDRGYTPEGPLFDVCIQKGIDIVTFNAAHRDATLMLKRYTANNKDVHPASIGPELWNHLKAMPWPQDAWQEAYDQLLFCYKSGQWYGEVGTQFRARHGDAQDLRKRLGLRQDRKVVLLFPHIFWDATFFWGRDLFAGYEEWFRFAAQHAWSDASVDWVVKLHPANLVKNSRDKVHGIFSEQSVLDGLGPVPKHVRVLQPDTDVSTLSLLEVGDVCLTVRGTVGIEAAALGLSVITAGTGRYDGLGFTIDAGSPDDYLRLLRTLAQVERPSARSVELARRYLYGLLITRPVELSTIKFEFRKDEKASLGLTINAQPLDPLGGEDIRAISGWILSGAEDFANPLN